MIEDKEMGLKIADNPREALIKTSIENSKSRILQTKLMLELEENALIFLETLK